MMTQHWFVVIAFIIPVYLFGIVNSNSGVFRTAAPSIRHHVSPDMVDIGLYSRQLLVYGKNSQQKLSNAQVILFGNGMTLDEVAKNLALAGVGTIILVDCSNSMQNSDKKRIIGDDPSLALYLKSLNPSINVEEYSSDEVSAKNIMSRHKNSVIIGCSSSFKEMKRLNSLARKHKVPFVATRVICNCGFVFNDFCDDFEVVDPDGESHKEIPLASLATNNNETDYVTIQSVDEEMLLYGIGDKVEITLSASNISFSGVVKTIQNSKTCILKTNQRMSNEDLQELKRDKNLFVKKIKESVVVHHKPLIQRLLQPEFSPTNGCLPQKQDRALSLSLLAAMQVQDVLRSNKQPYEVFYILMLEKLKGMGVRDPTLSLKRGGQVGSDWIQYVAQRMYESGCDECSATVSVMGSIAAQEVIKAITHMYMPASQFFLFESLDSIALNESYSGTSKRRRSSRRSDGHIYDPDVLEELARMKVFIVGSGAIGCELLKTFGLIGVGEGENGVKSNSFVAASVDDFIERNSLWDELHLTNGGIIVTDNDHIERSNLNRQLLFREKHIGQPKSIVAAEEILKVNPKLHIHALQMKVNPESESLFTDEFWKDCDVVVTALDNVQARQYVDQQCIRHKLFMIDSGTLGMKANSQVIIPYITETYSSSSDPPEEAIPMCTLKSFPYQPEHCVAWAKNLFQQCYSEDITNLRSYMDKKIQSEQILHEWMENITPEDMASLNTSLSYLPATVENSISWAINVFRQQFEENIQKLIQQHPRNETDEDGQLFWTGTRQFPKPTQFDVNIPLHRQFVAYGALLRLRAFGINDVDINILEEVLTNRDLSLKQEVRCSVDNAESLFTAEFEKDDFSLGHIQFVAAAANLRNENYGIRQVDLLEVQKVAGKIIPAVATTTSLVAGLASLELIKIASERVHMRKLRLKQLSAWKAKQAARSSENKSMSRKIWSKLSNLLRRKASSTISSKTTIKTTPKYLTDDKGSFTATYLRDHKDHILKRFRNSFINLATPMMAFTQPVEAEEFLLNDVTYNVWDELQIPLDGDSVTIEELKDYIHDKYHVYLKSIYIGDTIVYADFLNNSENDEALSRLLKDYIEENLEEYQDISTMKFDIICALSDLIETDDESEDIKLPPVVLSGIPKHTKQSKKQSWNLLSRLFGKGSRD